MKRLNDLHHAKKTLLLLSLMLFTGIYSIAAQSWVKKIYGTGDYWIKDITTDDNNNIYAIGGFKKYLFVDGKKLTAENGLNIFFAKFDGSGNLQWAKQFDGEGDIYARDIISDHHGHVYIGFEFENAINIGGKKLKAAFANDLAVAKFNDAGQTIWIKDISGKDEKRIGGMTMDNDGNVYVAGAFKETLDIDGQKIMANGEEDAFIIKLDPQAKLEWLKRLTSTKNAEVFGIAAGADMLGVTGTFTGKFTIGDKTFTSTDPQFDAWIAALDFDGNVKWVKHPEGSFDEIPTAIVVDNSGSVITAGSFKLNMDFGSKEIVSDNDADVFIVKYDKNGAFEWVKHGADNVRNATASDMIADDDDNIFLVGTFKESISFDDVGLIGPSNVDGPTAESIYLVKCTGDGKVNEGKLLGSIDHSKFNVIHKNAENDDMLIAGSFDQFADVPVNDKIEYGGTPSAIYIWKAAEGSDLFLSEKSIK